MSPKPLSDDAARAAAIAQLDRSLLVEAGAGSGKTAILAGRIAMLLAQGAAPKSIAAVTFTELAASELLTRVRELTDELVAGKVPAELRIAIPDGLTDSERGNLEQASAGIDEITLSTMHGFCQRLIRPYPVEADIDPGASVIDRDQADLAFTDIIETWIRQRLGGDDGGLLAELVHQDPDATLELVRKVLTYMRRSPGVTAPPGPPLQPLIQGFRFKAAAFGAFVRGCTAKETETAAIADRFVEMAAAVDLPRAEEDPAQLVTLTCSLPNQHLLTEKGTFRAFKCKTRWVESAKRAGLSKTDGERLNETAAGHYESCCKAWDAMLEAAAGHVLRDLISALKPVVERFRSYKRSAALLDFDDLLLSARNLLRGHEDVRRALARRYAHVLVDEFQDTDPLQTEILWRLCGDPPDGDATTSWAAFRIRPGALFLVGDPKQAIYRFRGADVGAYVRARELFQERDRESVLSIATNFRSCAPILSFVNERFAGPLNGDGQPGFTSLAPFHGDRNGSLCVAALDVTVGSQDGKASAEQLRDAEAEAVAELCVKLIGGEQIVDRRTGSARPCRPGDIALLAPTSTDLWRFEEALEGRGIPVATQAGKGLYRRQEIQDLIALTRVLSDRRDTLALAALLRGPLVGLSEEELLDIVWALPRSNERPDLLPRLDLGVEPESIPHRVARDVVEKLRSLRRIANATTPHDLLSRAMDTMRMRPILLQRHGGQAERALANVDLYLSMSRNYAVRGLRAFAEAMTAAWADETRAVEGRPDAQEESVALFTMHAAKGLEWPIVIPINTTTEIKAPDAAVLDRAADIFYCRVLGVAPAGYADARAREKAELSRERVRIWYVAATRARELLVIPRPDAQPVKPSWSKLVDLSVSNLVAIDPSKLRWAPLQASEKQENRQTREMFAREATGIADAHRRIVWVAPSRDEAPPGAVTEPDAGDVMMADGDREPSDRGLPPAVQGGRERGLVIHKLLEEVLTGETAEDPAALQERAGNLIAALGRIAIEDARAGLSAAEIAGCVTRTLVIPQIAALRPNLVPELPVYASQVVDGGEHAIAGVADALRFADDGTPEVVVDWKSDVDPAPGTVEGYRGQVRSYLEATGTGLGLLVFVTLGKVIAVKLTQSHDGVREI